MSAISEINKVWIQKFPGSSLPEAWAEDVKTNLSKHKKRVLELEEQLEQEKVYVGFLEDLLEEFRQVPPTTATQPDSTNGAGNTQDIDDVIKDTLERRSLAASFTFTPTPALKLPQTVQGSEVKDVGMSSEVGKEEPREGTDEDRDEESPKPSELTEEENPEVAESNCPGGGDGGTEEGRDRDHFVTVIEVNGFHKKAPHSPGEGPSSLQPPEDGKRLKKVPPRPPPKCFKRQCSETSQSAEAPPVKEIPIPDSQPSTSDSHPNSSVNGHRPIIFESRKLSTGIGGVGGIPSAPPEETSPPSEPTKPQTPIAPAPFTPQKRFEGSKLPLPGSQADQENKVVNSKEQRPESRPLFHKQQQQQQEMQDPPARSKILDLVNRMESSQKPVPSTKNPEPLTPRRSFRKPFQGPIYNSVPVEPSISDYVDPCDAEFDEVTSRNNDQIYDSPPPEEEDVQPHLDSPRNNSKSSTLDTRVSDGQAESSSYPDNEPMYDTVAPDQDDDYVLLLEEGNQTSSSTNSLGKKENEASVLNNNDGATIKSQTSIISGQSIATTTSSGTTSDTEGVTGSPLPHDHQGREHKNSIANYVNIDYFLSKPGRKDSQYSGESEDDDDPSLLRSISIQPDSDTHLDTPIDGFSLDSGVFSGPPESS